MDVAKGICRRTQETLPVDAESCASFIQLPKCKFCANYAVGSEEGIGACRAEADHPWAYPEMIAVTCGMFQPV